MIKEFKAGDKVYYPHFDTSVLTLVESARSSSFLAFEQPNKLIIITKNGKVWDEQGMVSGIVHATPETHELLEQLYGIEFEKPPTKPTSHEIIKAYLDRGDKNVCCWVSDYRQELSSNSTTREIHYIEDSGVTYYVATDGSAWFFATPIDPHTGTEITELPE